MRFATTTRAASLRAAALSLCTLALPLAPSPVRTRQAAALELPDGGAPLVSLPAAPSRVLDLQGWLTPAEAARLERILGKLHEDTGFELLVVTQDRARARAPEPADLLRWWSRLGPGTVGGGGRIGAGAVAIYADRGTPGALSTN